MVSLVLGFFHLIGAASGCTGEDVNSIKGCSFALAGPIITILRILVPVVIASGLLARGVQHRESPKSIAIDVLIGAILSEIVITVIWLMVGSP